MPQAFASGEPNQVMLQEHMSNISTTSFQNYTNLQDSQNFLILDVIGIIWYEWNQRNGLIQYIGMELYHKVGIIPWNRTKEMESYQWDHTKAMESYHGIIPWKWNHTIGTIPRPWNHTIGIIPRQWNHTMGSYQGNGIIPLGSYQECGIIPSIHRDSLTTFICQNKFIQNDTIKFTSKMREGRLMKYRF